MLSSRTRLLALLSAAAGALILWIWFAGGSGAELPSDAVRRSSAQDERVADPRDTGLVAHRVAPESSSAQPISLGTRRSSAELDDNRPVKIDELLAQPVVGVVRMADTGQPAAGLIFKVEQSSLWTEDGVSSEVRTDAAGRFQLDEGYRRARLSVGRAWREGQTYDPAYELAPAVVQLEEGVPLELIAHAPRLVLRVRGRLSDGAAVTGPRISLIGPESVGPWRKKSVEDSSGAYFDKSLMPREVWELSTEEESVYRLFPSEFDGAFLRAVFHSHRTRRAAPASATSAASTELSHVFDTDAAFELDGLSGELRHTFELSARPKLFVRLVDAEGNFAPHGVDAWARYHSGDTVPGTIRSGQFNRRLAAVSTGLRVERSGNATDLRGARITTGRGSPLLAPEFERAVDESWEFRTGWAIPGPCEVRLYDSSSGLELARRCVTLVAGMDEQVQFRHSELASQIALTNDRDDFLPKRLALSGIVQDERGEPLPKVELNVSWSGGSRRIFSQSVTGRFALMLPEDVGTLTVQVVTGVSDGAFQPSEVLVPFGRTDLVIQRTHDVIASVQFSFHDEESGAVVLGMRHCVLFVPHGAADDDSIDILACAYDEPGVKGQYSPGAGVAWRARVPHYRSIGGRTTEGLLTDSPPTGRPLQVQVPLQRGFAERFHLTDVGTAKPIAGARVLSLDGMPLGESGGTGDVQLERHDWPEGLIFEASGYESFELRLDWNGLCEHWDGEIELRPRQP